MKIKDGEIKIKDRYIIDGNNYSPYIDAYAFMYSRVGHILQKDGIFQIDINDEMSCDMLSIDARFVLPLNKFEVLDTQDSNT